MCRNYKSESRCIYGSSCLFRHADGEEKSRKRSKKESTQGAVAILTHREFQGCVSQNSDPKKSNSTESWTCERERLGATHH